MKTLYVLVTLMALIPILIVNTAQYVNPLPYNLRYPPIGVVSYGLYNISGKLYPYQIQTSEIEGGSNITSISAQGLVSLQLNTMLKINETNGQSLTYWLQDVIQINTANSTYRVIDNIWNSSAPYASVSPYQFSGSGQYESSGNRTYYWANNDPKKYYAWQKYSFPIYFTPIVKVSIQNSYPIVSFCWYSTGGPFCYDNVTFLTSANNAYLFVTPYYTAPNYNYYDAEFVFGGGGGGYVSTFNNLSANLKLVYYQNGNPILFPSIYTFGSDTEEGATNLVTYISSGCLYFVNCIHVSLGNNNYTKDIILNFSGINNQNSYATTINNYITTAPSTTTHYVFTTAQTTSIPYTYTVPSTSILYTIIPSVYTSSILQFNSSNTKSFASTNLGSIVIIIIILFVLYLAYRLIKSRKARR